MKIKKHTEIITSLLTSFPVYRDNDNMLIAKIWRNTLKENNIVPSKITGLKLLNIIATGKLPSSESIRRCRQKIQQHNKLLRGNTWSKRHHEQKKVKTELKTMAV